MSTPGLNTAHVSMGQRRTLGCILQTEQLMVKVTHGDQSVKQQQRHPAVLPCWNSPWPLSMMPFPLQPSQYAVLVDTSYLCQGERRWPPGCWSAGLSHHALLLSFFKQLPVKATGLVPMFGHAEICPFKTHSFREREKKKEEHGLLSQLCRDVDVVISVMSPCTSENTGWNLCQPQLFLSLE